ncbi:hypothetical protein LC608_30615 [Nostoc sp. XA010]|uniref:hypothetical protein n=1 Tax=Nostoc sp. XA010 TaxID=2780407 RepID=UPI001E54A2CB|nr:hypothetical protein [Nostoc sp. XA010]MCC5661239.1 hypothetical protein [Nostoc sp. XA010]
MLNSSFLLNEQAEYYGNVNEENTKQFHSKLSEYVAHIQLQMALQAQNYVPHSKQTVVSEKLLYQTQVSFEKLVSRQAI